jgi:hypothetical protein
MAAEENQSNTDKGNIIPIASFQTIEAAISRPLTNLEKLRIKYPDASLIQNSKSHESY